MIVVITGLMASGKSTVAELLAQGFERAVHLRGDAFRRMIVRGREDMAQSPTAEALRQLDLRYELSAHAAKEYHRAGFIVILQDNYYGEMLQRISALLEPEAHRIFVLCPDVETIKAREAARPKSGYTGFAVEPLHAAFMQTTPRLGSWIDNSAQTPQETAAHILRSLSLAPSPLP